MTTGEVRDIPGLPHRQILTILSVLLPALFLAALDQTVMVTAVRTIADDFDSYSRQAWVTTGYLIAATSTIPVYGRLSDGYGRRPVFAAAVVIFVAGSALCAAAPSMAALCAFRVVQGVGAGGMIALAFTIIGDIVPPRIRARYQGYILSVYGIAGVLGPVIGGVLAGAHSILGLTGWRWVFLVNVPIGLLTLIAIHRLLRLPGLPRRRTRLDWAGALTLTAGLVPLLVLADRGREWGWTSVTALTCLGLGGLGVAAFVLIEARLGARALLPVHLFRDRTVALGLAISFIAGFVTFGALALIPQFLQVVEGSSPALAGAQMLPAVLGLMLGSVVCSRIIARTGRYRILALAGTVTLAVGSLLIGRVDPDTPAGTFLVYLIVLGFGLGLLLQPLTVAIQSAVPAADLAVATAAGAMSRQLGGTLGVAVMLSVLFTHLPHTLARELERAGGSPEFRSAVLGGLGSPDAAEAALARGLAERDEAGVAAVLADSSIIQRLEPVVARPFEAGFAEAFTAVCPLAFVLAVLAFGVTIVWKEIPLRTSAGGAAPAEARRPSVNSPPDHPPA